MGAFSRPDDWESAGPERPAERKRRARAAQQSGERSVQPDERLLTVIEVATAMRVSNMTVYRLIKGGELPALRVGKNYRIRETEVDRYLLDRQVEGA